jgi:DNA polymerase III subunit delta'
VSVLAPSQHQYLFGHQDAVTRLKHSFDTNHLHHALILVGLNGVGKETLAYHLMRYALAFPQGNSNQSDLKVPEDHKAFKQLSAGNHAHVFVIEPVYDEKKGRFKRDITLDALDGLTKFLRLAPTEDAPRFILINPADGMNKNTQNALLKMLEEPPANTHFILLTSQIGSILPTIRSRCLTMNLDPLSFEDFQQAFFKILPHIEDHKVQPHFYLAQGALGQALQNEELGLFESYSELCGAILAWQEDSDSQSAMRIAENLGKSGEEVLADRLIETLLGRLALFLKTQITQEPMTAIIPEEERVLEMLQRFPSTKLLAIYDQIGQLWQAGDVGYLDRKLTLLQIIGLLSTQTL